MQASNVPELLEVLLYGRWLFPQANHEFAAGCCIVHGALRNVACQAQEWWELVQDGCSFWWHSLSSRSSWWVLKLQTETDTKRRTSLITSCDKISQSFHLKSLIGFLSVWLEDALNANAGRLKKEVCKALSSSSLADGLEVLPPKQGPDSAWCGAKLISNVCS